MLDSVECGARLSGSRASHSRAASWLNPTGGARVVAIVVLTLLAAAFVYKEVFVDTPRAEAQLALLSAELLEYPAPKETERLDSSTLARQREASLHVFYKTRLTVAEIESHYRRMFAGTLEYVLVLSWGSSVCRR